MLFLGCGILDLDFPHAYHTLLREPWEGNPAGTHYAAVAPPDPQTSNPYERFAAQIWEQMKTVSSTKYRVKIIEQPGEALLDRLRRELERLLAGGAGP
jgi:hypothetical protein